MPSPQLEQFLANFPESMMDEHDSLETVRAKMARIHPRDHAPETTVERFEIAGVECAWISTPDSDPSRTVFFVHGGAFVSTGITEYMTYGQTVANFCKARVLVPAYSLAPEAVYPRQLDELLAVYEAIDLETARTAFMGDSCGGGMALAPVAIVLTQSAEYVRDIALRNPDMVEPVETMAEAALELCTGRHVGQIVYSRELLHSVARAVRSLDGRQVLGDASLPADLGPIA